MRPAFLFSSQGGQWERMGLQLFRSDETFRGTVEACSEVTRRRLGWSLMADLGADNDRPQHANDLVQPAVTAIQIALTAVLKDRGVFPAAVVGLSMGELAAGYAAGALSAEDAMSVACAVALAVRHAQRRGRMAAISLSREETERHIAAVPRLWVAVELSPTLTIISGEDHSVEKVLEFCRSKGIHVVPETTPFAFHTPEMLPLRETFFASSPDLVPAESEVAIYSSVTGGQISGTDMEMSYWWRMMAESALFSTAVTAMIRAGFETFLEIGPRPILASAVAESARALGRHDVVVNATMTPDDEVGWLKTLAEGHRS